MKDYKCSITITHTLDNYSPSYGELSPMYRMWMIENLGYSYRTERGTETKFHFKSEVDAMAFKLMWC